MNETRDEALSKTLKHESLVFSICVDDAAAARSFYKQALGAREVHMVVESDGRVAHGQLLADDLAGGFQFFLGSDYKDEGMNTAAAKPGTAKACCHAWISTGNPDECVRRMAAAGATVTTITDDQPYGMRVGKVVDPFGVGWTFASHVLGKPN